jgi:hypothetical protein
MMAFVRMKYVIKVMTLEQTILRRVSELPDNLKQGRGY